MRCARNLEMLYYAHLPAERQRGESMEKHSEKSCLDFSKMLASKNPVPGGGGASALAGALGAALCAMVANYTIGKPKYSSVEAEVTTIRNQAEEIRMKLLKLMDADAEAFISRFL